MTVNPWALPLILTAIAAIILLTGGQGVGALLFLAAANAGIAVLGVAHSTQQGLKPTAAAFYIFWFSWLGVGALAQLTLGRVAWGDSVALADRSIVADALLLTVAAILAFSVGQRFGTRNSARSRELRAARVRPAVLVTTTFLLVGVAPVAIRAVGLSTYFTSRTDRNAALADSGISLQDVGGPEYAIYTVLPTALSISTALLSVFYIRERRIAGSRTPVLGMATLVIGLAGIFVFANPISQSRFVALSAFGSVLLATTRPRRTLGSVLFVGVGLVATLIVYPLANVFRGWQYGTVEIGLETFASNDFDGFQQFINTVHFVNNEGITYGVHILSAIFVFVPRALWPDKAVPASIDVAREAGYSFTNLSLPLPSEFYLEFGALGMVIGMAAIGYIVSQVDREWDSPMVTRLSLVGAYTPLAIVGITRGPLGSQAPLVLAVLVILWIGTATGKPTRTLSTAKGGAQHLKRFAGKTSREA